VTKDDVGYYFSTFGNKIMRAFIKIKNKLGMIVISCSDRLANCCAMKCHWSELCEFNFCRCYSVMLPTWLRSRHWHLLPTDFWHSWRVSVTSLKRQRQMREKHATLWHHQRSIIWYMLCLLAVSCRCSAY